MYFLVYSWALVIFLCSLSISSSKFFRRDKGFSNFITRRIPPSMCSFALYLEILGLFVACFICGAGVMNRLWQDIQG